jgi:ABC-type lipoprotein release transport system permease subunit
LATGTIVLALTAVIASMIPARHAAAADPMTALRCE